LKEFRLAAEERPIRHESISSPAHRGERRDGPFAAGLEAAVEVLSPGGRLAVITFHSVEDRVVKKFGSRLSRDYEAVEPDVPELRRPRPAILKWVERKAILPGAAELRENPRSRSAQCRVMEKCAKQTE